MKIFFAKARLVVCCLIIAAFFIPAYTNVSGFKFITLALSEAESQNGINTTDALFVVAPLILIPISAFVILIRSLLRMATQKTFLAFPLIFLTFFTALLIISSRNGSGSFSSPKTLLQMQPGFYFCVLSSALLIFTKDVRKKRRRKSAVTATEAIATA